jgi:hypothetical protein
MKTYYKSLIDNVYLMMDDSKKQYVITSINQKIKNIVIFNSEEIYDSLMNEVTDETKWLVSDETTFNSIITDVTSSI